MNTDAAPLHSDAAALAQSLSKSQKKRMKQKASKARKNAALDAEQRAEAATTPSGKSPSDPKTLNPHEKLCHDVVALGFSTEEVSKAMDEMWESNLRYDHFESVVSFLESKVVHDDADLYAAIALSMEEATQSTTASTSTNGAATADEAIKVASSATDVVPTISEEKQVATEDVPAPMPLSNSEQTSIAASAKSKGSCSADRKETAPVSLSSKLEMVSNFENISDAIFALTEWVTKAAKAQELSDFCDLRKCEALPTILRRVVFEGTDYMGPLLDLIGAVLRVAGAVASSVSLIAKALATAIVKARSIVTSEEANAQSLSSDVASNVGLVVVDACVASMRHTIDKLKIASQNPDQTIRRIEEEIDALAAGIPVSFNSDEPGVLELMTRRDCHKVAAEKYSTVAGIVILSATASGGREEDGEEIGVTDAGWEKERKKSLLVLLLGEEYDIIINNRAEYQALKIRLDDARASTQTERKALTHEKDALTSQKEVISARIEKLRLEMEALERESNDLGNKISATEDSLEDLDRGCDGTVGQLKVELNEKSKILKLEDEVGVVSSNIVSFESALSDATSVVAGRNGGNNDGKANISVEKMSNKMGIFFVRMRNYFKSEADCVEFLVSRALSLTNEVNDLEREIEECRSLGMVTNVAHMTLTLKRLRQNMEDDNAVVTALRGEAENMRDGLVRRLGEYKSASVAFGAEANSAFSSLQLSVLTGIKDGMSRIGIGDGGLHSYLDCFVGEVVAASPAYKENNNYVYGEVETQQVGLLESSPYDYDELGVDVIHNNENGSTVLPLQVSTIDRTSPEVIGAPQLTVAQPKFGWGTKLDAPKKPALSLIEIQRQEQELKKEDNEES